MNLIREINEACKQLNEMAGCENEEQSKKKSKSKTPRIFSALKDKFKTTEPTLTKVKNAIKAEFKKEAFSVEKEEWEKMSKDEQNKFAKAMCDKLCASLNK